MAVEEVLIKMGMDVRPVTAALRGVRKSVGDFKADLVKLNPLSLLQSAAGTVGIGLTIAAIGAAAKSVIEFAKQVSHLREETGVSAGTIQAFSMRVSKTGGDAEDAEKGLQKLTIKIGEARSGSASAIDMFHNMGIALKDANGHSKSTEQILNDVADRMSKIEDPTLRAQMAFELFGKSGIRLVNSLKDGSKALEDFKRDHPFKILTDQEVDRLESISKKLQGFGKGFVTIVGKTTAFASQAYLGDMGTAALLKKYSSHAPENDGGGETYEQKAEKAKSIAVALARLEKARRDESFGRMSNEEKSRAIAREVSELNVKIHNSEAGSLEQIELKTQLVEREKELHEAILRVQDDKIKKQEQAKEKQEQHNKQIEHEREVRNNINEHAAKARHANGELMDAKNDRSKFTLQELSGMGTSRWNTRDMNLDILDAKQIGRLETQSRQRALRGDIAGSQDLLSRADQLRKGMVSLKDSEKNPFESLEKSSNEAAQHLADLVDKAKGDGLSVNIRSITAE
jgi:hypothetical protein